MNDLIIQNIKQLILPKSTDRPLKGTELNELEIIENGTVVINDGRSFILVHIQMNMKLMKQ